MPNEYIQSIATSEQETNSGSILNPASSKDIQGSIDEKIIRIRKEFDARFPLAQQKHMVQQETFFRNFFLLSLLHKTRSIEEAIESSHKDKSSLELILDLYASQIIELDRRIEQYILHLGDWSADVLSEFIDSGHNTYSRYFTYKLLGTKHRITELWNIKFNYYKVLFLRGIFGGLILLNTSLLAVSRRVSGTTIFNIPKSLLLQLFFTIGLITSIILLFYVPTIDYWLRNIGHSRSDDPEVRDQIKFAVGKLNDLVTDCESIKQEIKFNLSELIKKVQKFQVSTNYESYLTVYELKKALLNEKVLCQAKRNVLLTLIDYRNLFILFSDYTFTYWVLRPYFHKGLVFIVAIISSLIIGYTTLPILSGIPFFGKLLAADVVSEMLVKLYTK